MTSDCVIDCSHYQGRIDWPKVFGAGKRLVIAKATQGSAGRDPSFTAYRAGAIAAGLRVMPYHFLTTDDPQRQAENFVRTAGLRAGGAYALDWEGDNAPSGLVVAAVATAVRAVTARAPLGYWGDQPPHPLVLDMAVWPKWTPRYGADTGAVDPAHPPVHPWLFWQYTSKGHVPGITENTVDLSLFAGTVDELYAWLDTGELPAPSVEPPAPAGDDARELQRLLTAQGYAPGLVDGVLGDATGRALGRAVRSRPALLRAMLAALRA